TRQPTLVSEAIARIFHGSGPRVVLALIVLAAGLALLWILIASVGRTVTLHRILESFRDLSAESGLRFGAMAEVHFLRVAVSAVALLAGVAALLLAGRVSTPTNPAPGRAVLIFFPPTFFLRSAWSFLNWVLSLSSIFVVTEGRSGFGAVSRAVNLLRDRTGAVVATGTWFELSHLTLFVIASSAIAFPLAFAQLLPAATVVGGVLLMVVLYFAGADFLDVGRLAALVAILEAPPIVTPEILLPEPAPPSLQDESGRVDQDELILGDRPEWCSQRHSFATSRPTSAAEAAVGPGLIAVLKHCTPKIT